jgi:HK97 family phage prohead protease
MERRFIFHNATPVQLVKRAEGDPAKIVGVGAVFYDGTPNTEYELWNNKAERAVERVMPGACAKALARPDDVRGLFNHDPNQLLGRTSAGTMKLSADGLGLKYEIDPGNTSIARDVTEHLNRKDVTGSSFAFIVDEERWTETKDAAGKWNSVREIQSVTLFDCGPVTYPAYEATSAGTRAAGDVCEARKSLETFREQAKGDGLGAKLTQYRTRARIVELDAR